MIDNWWARYLYAADSFGCLLAAWAWWRVYQKPTEHRLCFAAICTAAGFCIKFLGVSLIIILRQP